MIPLQLYLQVLFSKGHKSYYACGRVAVHVFEFRLAGFQDRDFVPGHELSIWTLTKSLACDSHYSLKSILTNFLA